MDITRWRAGFDQSNLTSEGAIRESDIVIATKLSKLCSICDLFSPVRFSDVLLASQKNTLGAFVLSYAIRF